MAFLVSAIAGSLTETDAYKGEERISPLNIVAFLNSLFLVGWLILIAIG
jgi:hypothetical protein